MYELGLIGLYNLRSGQLLASTVLSLPMLTHRKIHLLPKRYPGRDEVKRIFERVAAMEEGR